MPCLPVSKHRHCHVEQSSYQQQQQQPARPGTGRLATAQRGLSHARPGDETRRDGVMVPSRFVSHSAPSLAADCRDIGRTVAINTIVTLLAVGVVLLSYKLCNTDLLVTLYLTAVH